MGFPTTLRAGEGGFGYSRGATRRGRSRSAGRRERGDVFRPGGGRGWNGGRDAGRAGAGGFRRPDRGSACPGRPPRSPRVASRNDPAGVWILAAARSTVRFRAVKLVRVSGETAVISGLSAGDPVVSLGAHLLREGARVRTGSESWAKR